MAVYLSLLVGPVVPVPATPDLSAALSSVEVTRTDDGPGGFQLTFAAQRDPAGLDYTLLETPLLWEFNRVLLVVTAGFVPYVLMDGFITHREISSEGTSVRVVVTGEDVSVKMDLIEVSQSYPYMPDFLVATTILARYASLGVIPAVMPPTTNVPPIENTPQQVSTDRVRLQSLAQRYDHQFFVKPGPLPGMNTAYWGPQPRLGLPSSAVALRVGSFSNTSELTANSDALKPALTYGTALEAKVPVPFTSVAYTRLPPLALVPPKLPLFAALGMLPQAFPATLPVLSVKGRYLQHPGWGVAQAQAAAMSRTNLSADDTLTVEGTVNTSSYGGIMDVPGLVGVRGAGLSLDGMYYVKQVRHSITFDRGHPDYTQNFTLTREGVGTTTPVVPFYPNPGV